MSPDATQGDAPGVLDAAEEQRPAHCGAGGEGLPAWATLELPHQLVARCGDVTLRVDALADGILRLRYGGDAPRPVRSWSPVTLPEPAAFVSVRTAGAQVELCTSEWLLAVDEQCRIQATDPAGRVLVADAAGFHRDATGASIARYSAPDERFYGFGERTGPLDRRGQRMTFWNTDAYDPALGGWRPDQDPLYQSIPLFVALGGGVAHGVFTDDTRKLVMDMARAAPDAYEVHTPGDSLEQYLIAGPRIADVVRRYTSLTGRSALPPRWALGFHQSRWGYATGARVEEIAAGFRQRDIPADVLWLDIQHLRGFRTFTWDPATFPDPAGLLGRLGALGFRVIVIADPGIKVDPGWDVFDGGVTGDHFLRTASGARYEGNAWPGASSFPDFTRAETRAWWAGHIGQLVDRGVDGIWLDVNEPTVMPEGGGGNTVPDELVAGGDAEPATMAEVHNVYANLEAQATVDGLVAAAPERRPFVLSRAGYAGIQRHAAVWTGDVVSSWEGLAQTLPMLLGLGLSGVPIVGSDVGGYSGHATPELFARWMAIGAVSPFFRAHVTNGVPGQEPWAFGVEVEEISRRLIGERYRLLPYFYTLLAEAAETGAPVLRPLVYEFQEDARTHGIGNQAMLGPFLMVAPVVVAGALARDVYFPAGRWFEARSGAVIEGPGTVSIDVTLAALPTFVRAGAILPRGPIASHTDAATGALELDLYPAPEPSELVLHEDAGDGSGPAARTRYELAPTATGFRFTASRTGGFVPPSRTLVLRVHRVDHAPIAVRIDGQPAGSAAEWDADDLSLSLTIPDRPAFVVEVDHDRSLVAPRPPVRVTLEVSLPAGTPDGPIFVATSDSSWTHTPLVRVSPTLARGTVEVERGAWFLYKYSRGDWTTVEKQAGCGEVTNRYRFGAARERQLDVIAKWRDRC